MMLKNGDIVFVDKGTKWGDLVGWFQEDRYHHVGVIIRMAGGNAYVFEALDGGPAFTEWSDYLDDVRDKGYRLLIMRLRGNQFDGVKQIEYQRLCIPLTRRFYEFLNLGLFQAIRFGSKKIMRLLGIKRKPVWIGKKSHNSTNQFICSELVGYVYFKMLGMFAENWWKLAPSDIKRNPNFEVIDEIYV